MTMHKINERTTTTTCHKIMNMNANEAAVCFLFVTINYRSVICIFKRKLFELIRKAFRLCRGFAYLGAMVSMKTMSMRNLSFGVVSQEESQLRNVHDNDLKRQALIKREHFSSASAFVRLTEQQSLKSVALFYRFLSPGRRDTKRREISIDRRSRKTAFLITKDNFKTGK